MPLDMSETRHGTVDLLQEGSSVPSHPSEKKKYLCTAVQGVACGNQGSVIS